MRFRLGPHLGEMHRRRRQEMGWPDFVFALHNNEDRGPRMLAPISKHTGQRLGDSLDRNSHPQRRIGLLSTLLPTPVTTGGGRLSKRRAGRGRPDWLQRCPLSFGVH